MTVETTLLNADDLKNAFALYLAEIKKAQDAGCYWALLHLIVVVPDICAGLEGQRQGAERYLAWCRPPHFPADPTMTPIDRYKLRCALLHEGSTLTGGGGQPIQLI